MACNSTRLRALALYKELHRLGRDYPDPSYVIARSHTLTFIRINQLTLQLDPRYDFHGRIRRLYESEPGHDAPCYDLLSYETSRKQKFNQSGRD